MQKRLHKLPGRSIRRSFVISMFLILTLFTMLFGGCASKNESGSSNPASSKDGSSPENENRPEADVPNSVPNNNTSSAATVSPYDELDIDTNVGTSDYDTGKAFETMSVTEISCSKETASINGENAHAENSVITISAEGVYHISGTWNGQIVVDADDDAHIELLLDNASVSSFAGSPIHIENAKKVVVWLSDGTVNTLTDTTATESDSSDTTAAIYSKDDLTVNGTGTLLVNADTNGIISKNKLKILGGTVTVEAGNNGMRGKDCVAVFGGEIAITAGNDGIKSETSDETTAGFVRIDGGSVNITSGGDAIHGEYAVIVTGGLVNAVTGGGSLAASPHRDQMGFGKPEVSDSSTSVSTKGLKSDYSVKISGGEITVDSEDDAIHSGNTFTLDGGILTLASGDDGIHADSCLTITGGNYTISKSYEGLESVQVQILGGTGSVTASDDGINCNSGNSGFEGFGMHGGMNAVSEGTLLSITGGTIYVNAEGDGLDSNGNVIMSGGTVLVDGPTGNGNGALDYNGSFNYSGGLLIAAGSSGMAQSVTVSEGFALMINYPNTQSAGTLMTLTGADNDFFLAFAPAKNYSNLVIASPDLINGSYTLTSGGTCFGTAVYGLYSGGTCSGTNKLCDFETSSPSTSIQSDGTAYSGGMGGFGGGFGGGMGGNRGDKERPDGMSPGGMPRPDDFDKNGVPGNRPPQNESDETTE